MLKKRIIPILLLNGKRLVKGIEFENFKDTGSPLSTAKVYNSQKVDELIFLDINPEDDIDILVKVIDEVSEECFMPLTVGGGIRNLSDAQKLIESGADKVAVNTMLYESPEEIGKIISQFGSQAVVASIDVRKIDDKYVLFSSSGKIQQSITLEEMIKLCIKIDVGEILITSIDHEGKMLGYDIELIKIVSNLTNKPIICNGGAGKLTHLTDVFNEVGSLSAVALSSIFHFTDQSPIKARSYLINSGIETRKI